MKDSPRRLEQAIRVTEENGGEFMGSHLTMGRYDAVYVAQFPDEQSAATATLTIGQGGAVETETMMAFDEAAYREICESLP